MHNKTGVPRNIIVTLKFSDVEFTNVYSLRLASAAHTLDNRDETMNSFTDITSSELARNMEPRCTWNWCNIGY